MERAGAANNLGVTYADGYRVPEDDAEAVKRLRKATAPGAAGQASAALARLDDAGGAAGAWVH